MTAQILTQHKRLPITHISEKTAPEPDADLVNKLLGGSQRRPAGQLWERAADRSAHRARVRAESADEFPIAGRASVIAHRVLDAPIERENDREGNGLDADVHVLTVTEAHQRAYLFGRYNVAASGVIRAGYLAR